LRWADVYVPHVSPASMYRWLSLSWWWACESRRGRWPTVLPSGDDEQRVGLALDAMGRRLRAPRLPGVGVPAPSAPALDAMGRRLPGVDDPGVAPGTSPRRRCPSPAWARGTMAEPLLVVGL